MDYKKELIEIARKRLPASEDIGEGVFNFYIGLPSNLIGNRVYDSDTRIQFVPDADAKYGYAVSVSRYYKISEDAFDYDPFDFDNLTDKQKRLVIEAFKAQIDEGKKPSDSFPVIWIWDIEASLAADYRKGGIEGLITALRDIKAADPVSFEDDVHAVVTGTFTTQRDAEMFAAGIAYAHSGEAQGAPSDVLREDADVFVTAPGDVEALMTYLTEEGFI